MLLGLLIRKLNFHIGSGMIFAIVSRRGTGAIARTIFNDRLSIGMFQHYVSKNKYIIGSAHHLPLH